jgi:GWxTD domain-containing protein
MTPFEKWAAEDVAYIITDAERRAFKGLTTDEEREQFVEQFWDRRDPTPGTPANEFKDEHYRRIAYANDHFQGAIPGWKSDRGRIYISFGPPDEIDSHATERWDLWTYRYIEGIGNNVTLRFEDRDRDGAYYLVSPPIVR